MIRTTHTTRSCLASLRAAAACLALAATVILTGTACDDRASDSSSVTPGGRGGDSHIESDGPFEGETMAELNARLDRLTTQRAELTKVKASEPAQCEELCQISKTICEVKKKMCEIAESRVTDDEYQNLCRKAKMRCGEANQTCISCVEQHETKGAGLSTRPASCGGEAEPDTVEPAPAASDAKEPAEGPTVPAGPTP